MTRSSAKPVIITIWLGAVAGLCAFGLILLRNYLPEPQVERSLARLGPDKIENLRTVKLFFADGDGLRLLPEDRIIAKGNILQEVRAVADAMIAGPRDSLAPTIPPETRLTTAHLIDDLLVLDFSRELQSNHVGGTAGETLTIYSLVNTITLNFPQVTRVQILVEGEEIESLAGHIDASRPFSEDLRWITM